MPVVNVAITDTFILRDSTNAAITGKVAADFATIEAYQVNSPGTTAAITLTEIGNGEYAIAFTPTSAAIWTAHVVYNSGGIFHEFSETYDVAAGTTAVTVVASAPAGGLSLTLAQLRRRAADRFGDYEAFVCTANSDTTHAISTLSVNGGAENYNGRWLAFSSGGNAGVYARVTATTDSTGTLTFTPAVANATAAGDTIDIYNKRGLGFSVPEYNRAVNNAIDDAYPLGMIAIQATLSPVFDQDTPEITVPADFVDVSGLEWQDASGLWHAILRSSASGAFGWSVNPAAGTISLRGAPGYQADNMALRLTGYGRQGSLATDADVCVLNAEYIVARACYHLAAASLMRDSAYAQLTPMFQQESEKKRTRMRTQSAANRTRVRPA